MLDILINICFSAKEKLGMMGGVKVVLEQDGTEVDEEEYFITLERNTSLMLLGQNEKWALPGRKHRYVLAVLVWSDITYGTFVCPHIWYCYV